MRTVANRAQLTIDGHKAYLEAVEGAFGGDADFAQMVKLYGRPTGKKAPWPQVFTVRVCREQQALRDWRLRTCSHQHVLCRAQQPDDADGHAAPHPPGQRLQQATREPPHHLSFYCVYYDFIRCISRWA